MVEAVEVVVVGYESLGGPRPQFPWLGGKLR